MDYSTWSRRVVDLAAALARLEAEAEAEATAVAATPTAAATADTAAAEAMLRGGQASRRAGSNDAQRCRRCHRCRWRCCCGREGRGAPSGQAVVGRA